MGASNAALTGPDLAQGVPEESVTEGKPLLGRFGDEAVLLCRAGRSLYAVAASCPHYGAPLAEGLQRGVTLRCPWHHAAFDLETGRGEAPAINPLACYELRREVGQVKVIGRREPRPHVALPGGPSAVVIIGGGAAGHSAAETLRRRGYGGPVTVLSADESLPYDRPNLSKDYLAGTAPEEWIPLRSADDYAAQQIAFRTGARVTAIDPQRHAVTLAGAETLSYGALLLATGAEALRLDVPGAAHAVQVLRTLRDAREVIRRAEHARSAVIIGASFIALEAASALRSRGLEVTVIGLEAVPMERLFGPEVGHFLQRLHEANGVRFHLSSGVREIRGGAVELTGGGVVEGELLLAGIGVRPSVELAQQAQLRMASGGVWTDSYLHTSAPDIWAAGDVARWPDPRTGAPTRIEHWVVAQRQGAIAARNILGEKIPFTAVPFFWSVQHGVTLSFVGNGAAWDSLALDGSLERRDFTVRYFSRGHLVAALCVGRDRESLALELELERHAHALDAEPASPAAGFSAEPPRA